MPSTRHFTFAALALATTLVHADERLTVARDPETGALRAPTAAEAEALRKLTLRQRSPVLARVGGIQTQHPDGSVELSLGDDSMMSSIAVRQPDGSVRMECLPAPVAEKRVRGAVTAARVPSVQPPQKDAAGHDLY